MKVKTQDNLQNNCNTLSPEPGELEVFLEPSFRIAAAMNLKTSAVRKHSRKTGATQSVSKGLIFYYSPLWAFQQLVT